MKTKTDARLTLSYLRKLERENYLALALVVLLSASWLLWVALPYWWKYLPRLCLQYHVSSGFLWPIPGQEQRRSRRGFAVQCPTPHSCKTDFI